MNRELVGLSLSKHGSYLMDQLRAEEQIALEDVIALKSSIPIPVTDEPEDGFDRRLLNFIAKKADLLFCKHDNFSTRDFHVDKRRSRYCAVLPPLEYFMEVSKTERRYQLFKNIDRGCLVVGIISALHETGFTLTLVALDGDMSRDIADLKIQAFCPLREIPKTHAHENALEAYSIKDKVRAVVLGVNDEKITISLQRRALPAQQDTTLGLITEEDLPPYYRTLLAADSRPYGIMLSEAPEFRNPSDVTNMAAAFGLGEAKRQPSLMRGLFRVQYRDADYADTLRKEQSSRLAMRSVADGVDHFKNDRVVEAMQMFNKALQVDPTNVEALVARGALYANSESYRRALEDFDAALDVNPNHTNARKYACDTLLALGRSMLEAGDTEGAISRVYRASLLQPNNPETTELLAEIQRRMLNSEKVTTPEKTDDDCSTVLRAKESLIKLMQKDEMKKKRRSSTKGDEAKTRKRKKSGRSSSVSSSSSSGSKAATASKNRRNKRKRASEGSSDSDSVVELSWIPRDADTSSYELFGSTSSGIRKGYDVSLINPERQQSTGDGPGNSNHENPYGPTLPPGQPAKMENDENATKAHRGESASSSSSSDSGSSSDSSSSSAPSQSNARFRKRRRESQSKRRTSLNESKSKDNKKRNNGNSDTRSRNRTDRRSKSSNEDKREGARRRLSNISSSGRRTSGNMKQPNGPSADDNRVSSIGRRSDQFKSLQRPNQSRDSNYDQSKKASFDRRRSAPAKPRSRSPERQSSNRSSLNAKKLDGNKRNDAKTGSKTGAKKSQDDIVALGSQSCEVSSTDNKTGGSKETLEDMESFLKQLKAQAKLNAIKK